MLQCTSNVTDCAPIWRRRLAMMLVLCLLSMGAVGVAMGAAARQKSFPTPEEGVRALIEAAQRHDTNPAGDPRARGEIHRQHRRPGLRSGKR